MTNTNAWNESTPIGTEDASTTDDYLIKHRLDLGERLEDMFYGFNTSDNADAENDYGVKSLRFFEQTSDPTKVTDYAHVYVKIVDGVPELFYQDDENTAKQLTSSGQLNVVADDIASDAIDGTKIADDAIDSEHYTDGSIDLAHLSANSVDSDQYVDGSIDAVHIANLDPDSYSGEESITLANNLMIKRGSATSTTDDDETFAFASAFPSSCLFVAITRTVSDAAHAFPIITKTAANFKINRGNGIDGNQAFDWFAIGY